MTALRKTALGANKMDMCIPVHEIPISLDRGDYSWIDKVVANGVPECFTYHVIGRAAEFAQELPVIAEVDAKTFGDGEHPLPVGNGCQDFSGQTMAQKERSLLATTWTGGTLTARVCHKHFFAAIIAPYTREPLLEVAAFEELVDGSAYHRPPETVLLLELFRVNTLKLFKMAGHHLEERGGFGIAPPVDLPGLGYFADHGVNWPKPRIRVNLCPFQV